MDWERSNNINFFIKKNSNLLAIRTEKRTKKKGFAANNLQHSRQLNIPLPSVRVENVTFSHIVRQLQHAQSASNISKFIILIVNRKHFSFKMSSKSVALTSKQQNHTLAAKKKKQKKSFRYILADPFPRYWYV